MATDWSACPAVERDPKRLGGALVFRGTRMPVATLFENLKSGATVDETRSMQSPVVQKLGL